MIYLKKKIKGNGDSIRKLINNQKGFSLTDLMASLPLTVLVFIVMIIALTQFSRSYMEVKYFVQLQSELFDVVETFRYGIAKDGVSDDNPLMGIMSARSVEISAARTAIVIKPIMTSSSLAADDFKSRIWLTDNGEIKGWSRYGVLNTGTITLFPSGNNKINGQNRFKVTNLEFYPKKTTIDGVAMVGVKIAAEVRYRIRRNGESREEDLRNNVKSIDYETFILVGNAGL